MSIAGTSTAAPTGRSRLHGVAQIVRFNWPFYVAAIAGNVVLFIVAAFFALPASLVHVAIAGAFAGDFWVVASLAVSHLIYDRSSIARGAWLDLDLPVRAIGVFHAGHDEASHLVRRRHPSAVVHTFDFLDMGKRTEASIRRARAAAVAEGAPPATAIAVDAIPLPTATLDLACVVFAAHELRADADRIALFRELHRVVTTGGVIIVVEHLRDGWNLLAYGPGAFHFLPRGAWSATFAGAHLTLRRETRRTPFVTIFELGAAA